MRRWTSGCKHVVRLIGMAGVLVIALSVAPAAARVPEILAFKPIGLEGFEGGVLDVMRQKRLQPENIALLPPGGGYLLAEFGGDTRAEADAKADEFVAWQRQQPDPPQIKVVREAGEVRRIWKVREAGNGSTTVGGFSNSAQDLINGGYLGATEALNDGLTEIVRKHPDRFAPLARLPASYAQASIAETGCVRRAGRPAARASRGCSRRATAPTLARSS